MAIKKSSQILNIGAELTESAPNTYTQQRITLPLNSLDREVFVVTDVVMSHGNVEPAPGLNASNNVQVTKTSQQALVSIADPDTLGISLLSLNDTLGSGTPAVVSDRHPGNSFSTGTDRDYIAIIATPDFFLASDSNGQVAEMTVACRITGYRAVASADTYAALVTEELNA